MSERYLGSYSYNHGNETVNETLELEEDDVWSTVDNMVNGDDSCATAESNRCLSSSRSCRHAGGLSLAFDDTTPSRIFHQLRAGGSASPHGCHLASSAPVNVPDWSKIYLVNSVESFHDSDGVDDHELDMIPPHEYLARGYVMTRKSSTNSVFEGVGRTLKGRDMSRVRDAVWSQTRFNG